MARIVILGAGTAGTIMANRLQRLYADDIALGTMSIVVVDQDNTHVYQPGLLFVPCGTYRPEQIVRSRPRQLHRDITYVHETIDHVDTADKTVHLGEGTPLHYDVLIVATGSRIAPEETEGMLGEGWRSSVFDFYSLEGATALRDRL